MLERDVPDPEIAAFVPGVPGHPRREANRDRERGILGQPTLPEGLHGRVHVEHVPPLPVGVAMLDVGAGQHAADIRVAGQ